MEKQDTRACGLCYLFEALTRQASPHMLAGVTQKGLVEKETETQKETLWR